MLPRIAPPHGDACPKRTTLPRRVHPRRAPTTERRRPLHTTITKFGTFNSRGLGGAFDLAKLDFITMWAEKERVDFLGLQETWQKGRDLVTSKSMLYMFLNKASFTDPRGRPSGGVACGLSSRVAREWKATGRRKRCWGVRIMAVAWGHGQQSGGGIVAYAPDGAKGTASYNAFLERKLHFAPRPDGTRCSSGGRIYLARSSARSVGNKPRQCGTTRS